MASAGSSLISYGRECVEDLCPQWSYLFWQRGDGVQGAGLEPGGQWEQLGPSLGASSGGFDSNGVAPPGANSSLAIAMARASPPANDSFRSISMFYRAETGALGQIIYERKSPSGGYRGYALPRRDLGPDTAIAVIPTGGNATDQSAWPLGFQVLTADPDAGDGVQLTYYRDAEWIVGGDVPVLADCGTLAMMTATRARRVYCVVKNAADKADIVEFAWGADPEGDVSAYTDYQRVGTINTTVGS